MTAGWAPTVALYRAAAIVVFGVGMGLVTGRADLVVLAAPVALGLLLALFGRRLRPHLMAEPRSAAMVGAGIVSGSTVAVRATLDGLADAELVTVMLPDTTARPTGSARTVAGGTDRELDTAVDSRSWGPTMLARPDLLGVSADGLFIAGPVAASETWELVLPAVPRIQPLQLPPINGGWAGAHTSRRPGQGSDLVDLRDYAPGDRMRSVHWRAYARLGKMYTRRTLSDADADLTICLDVRQNIGPKVPVPPVLLVDRTIKAIADSFQLLSDARSARAGGPNARDRLDAMEKARYSSLDHTVHAASAIASAQLGVGDRVGVMSVTGDHKALRPGTGTRHLQRIRYLLAKMTSSSHRMTPVAYWGLRPGAVVVLCSPLADDLAAQAAVDCGSRGHQVVVIDTLPAREILRAAVGTDAEHLRVLSIQREMRIETIRRSGIPVLSWESGSIDLELARALKASRARR